MGSAQPPAVGFCAAKAGSPLAHQEEQEITMSNQKTSPTSDPSPQQTADRAQPGDVLGVETDGKRTHLGDDAEDENEALEDAEDELAEKADDEDDD